MKDVFKVLLLASIISAYGCVGKDNAEGSTTHDSPWGTFITKIDGMSYRIPSSYYNIKERLTGLKTL